MVTSRHISFPLKKALMGHYLSVAASYVTSPENIHLMNIIFIHKEMG